MEKDGNGKQPETQPARKWWARLRETLGHQQTPAGWQTQRTTVLALVHQGVLVSIGSRDGRVGLRMSLETSPRRTVQRTVPAVLAREEWQMAELLDDMHAELRR